MLVFKIMPGKKTPAFLAFAKKVERTFLVTSNDFSIVWSPSINTSGSQIGTRPAAWVTKACFTIVSMLASIASCVGTLLPIGVTVLHLVNRAPSGLYFANL